VVYVGANDGMLHAFNVGFYDRDHGAFYDHTGYTIGQELWAFIPHQLLPHLEFLTQVQYVHVYFMDQKPRIFDARVFTPDSTHVNGWGTLLIAGMRMGGKTMQVDLNGDGTRPMRERPSARLLPLRCHRALAAEVPGAFTDSVLGLTISYPAIFRIGDKWFMAVGSGPNGTDAYLGKSAQRGWLYVVEITLQDSTPPSQEDPPPRHRDDHDRWRSFCGGSEYGDGLEPHVHRRDQLERRGVVLRKRLPECNLQRIESGDRLEPAVAGADASPPPYLGYLLNLPDPTGTGWPSPVPKLAVSSATIRSGRSPPRPT